MIPDVSLSKKGSVNIYLSDMYNNQLNMYNNCVQYDRGEYKRFIDEKKYNGHSEGSGFAFRVCTYNLFYDLYIYL